MTCPCCGGPMGFSEATALGNCLKCDGDDDFPWFVPLFAVGCVLAVVALALVLA